MSNDTNSLALPLPTAAAGESPAEKKLFKRATRQLERSALAAVASRVAVVRPQTSGAVEELVLPANVQAFVEAPIYARTHGYLKRWYFDIGAHVQQGQLMAEIETPEVDQQLAQARADL